MIDIDILNKLNHPDKNIRLTNLREICREYNFPAPVPQYINNHIHTTYSFSPYSPTAAVFAAKAEGLCTAGIVDHDSISGAREFIDAGRIADIPVTVGMECRVSFKDTPLESLRINNPDQRGVAYMTIQSVPHDKIDVLDEFFVPYRAARESRNRRMTENINKLLRGIRLDYDEDIRPLSMSSEGGSVTERHIMYALALAMTKAYGKGNSLISYLEECEIKISDKQRELLCSVSYPFYEYDLLGILKSTFVPKIYIDATEECPALRDIVRLCCKIDAYLCYAYLGDVSDSVTGDKAAQKFEDDYLDLVFDTLKENGISCITYMPTRNSEKQLERLRSLCENNDFLQISGEDINSPRQSFVIKAMENPLFKNLIESTWKLIEHEKEA